MCGGILRLLNKIIFIHPKSESSSLDSANDLNFPQNYSLRTLKLPNLLYWILSHIAKALKMCQRVVKKCHKWLMNMFLVSDSPTLHILGLFLMIYALLSQNFDVEIYTLFLQMFCDWKADSTNFFAFRMYDYCVLYNPCYCFFYIWASWERWKLQFKRVLYPCCKKNMKLGLVAKSQISIWWNLWINSLCSWEILIEHKRY